MSTMRWRAAVAALILMVGCSSGTTPSRESSSPVPTTHATPVPTAEVDVAASFMRAINDPAFSASAALTGSVRFGDIETALEGEMRIRGADSYLRLAASVPGAATSEFESVTLGTETFERTDGGLWMLEAPGDPNTGGLQAGFDFTSLRVAGTRTLGDATLQRLLPVGGTPVTPSMLGFTDPTITDFGGSVEFLARDDGTPAAAVFEGQWNQLVQGRTTECAFDLTIEFARVGLWVRIDRPEQAWSPWTSESLAYAIAFPDGWEATAIAEHGDVAAYDRFLGPIDQEIQVYHYTDLAADVTPAMVYQWVAGWILETYGVQPDRWEDLTVGDLPARLFRVHYTEETGTEVLFMEAIVLGSDSAWDICWYSTARSDPPDRSLFGDFLSTFHPAV
jgi:hypothetical protein